MRTLSKAVQRARLPKHRTFLFEIVTLDAAKLAAFRRNWHVPATLAADDLFRFRDDLRIVWAGRTAASRDVITRWLARCGVDERPPFVLDWTPETNRIRPNTGSFPVALAHAAVYSLSLMRYCQRPNCPNGHYFIGRQDQKYCPGACRAWRTREIKRKSAEDHKDALKERRCLRA